MKKGQVTIFIIVAILIVAGVVLFFILRGGIEKETSMPQEVAPVYNFVQGCLEEVSDEVVYAVGARGGEYSPEQGFEIGGSGKVVYYLKEGQLTIPSKGKIENEIATEISKKLPECINNFESFSEFEINDKSISISAKIEEDYVAVELNYPMTIKKKGEIVSNLQNFDYTLDVNLGLMHNAISDFVKESKDNLDKGLCLTCMSEVGYEYDMEFNVLYVDNETSTYLFIVTDYVEDSDEINNETYIYGFAMEY